MPSEPQVDPARYDLDRPRWGVDEVRSLLPHRHEFEQLSGILEVDPEDQSIVGFRRYTDADHWVRGHVPGSPLLPGILIVEAAAQLGTCYIRRQQADWPGFWALAGVDKVRFRGAVRPGQTVIYWCRMRKVRPKVVRFAFQAICEGQVVAEGELTGVRTASLVAT